MFDWDDEVLANIIWGEAGENEDHIVPFPDETFEKPPGSYGEHSKKRDQESANLKLTEKTTLVSNIDPLEGKVGSNINYGTCRRVSVDGLSSLPDLSSSDATKLDLEHMDEKDQVDNGSQTFDNQRVDIDASNFVDYGWANMGSFDDLDRILSNNDLVYGSINISNTNASRSSSKDVIDCLEKSDFLSIGSPSLRLGAFRSDCEHVETKSDFIKDENQANDSRGEMNDDFCHSKLSLNTSLENLECGGGKNEHLLKEKHAQMGGHGKSPRCQQMTGVKSEARPSQISCGLWFSIGNQGKEFEGQYSQHIKSSTSKHPEVPASRQFHSREEHQQVPSGSSYLSDKIPDVPLIMTPQEKIEKLRRRQKMRAMLAIRKQQQQFRHQVSLNDSDNVEIDGSLNTLLCLEASSEQSDSDIVPTMIDKSTMEDTVLRQLENVIARLGTQIRLCIRDSLFRLAQNSLQRQYAVDTSSPNKSSRDENVLSEERLTSKKSLPSTPDGETETNHIDRMVAHLLFHRPLELQSNAKLPRERETTSTDFPMEFLNESHEDDQLSCLAGPENKLKSSCIDGSEIASNNKTADGGVIEIEASSRGRHFV